MVLSVHRDGELVLMDAGAEYHGVSSDITRTWPVNGKYTPEQRKVYEAVLRVHDMAIEVRGAGEHVLSTR